MSNQESSLTVLETATVKDAMKQMDHNAHKIIYIVDEENHLKGVLSDGDAVSYTHLRRRRWTV